jgi:hypothetical protein
MLSLFFLNQNFTSLAYNVTAVEQNDTYGYGPAYLLNGLTVSSDQYWYWYQVGVSYDWSYTNTSGGGSYWAGFRFAYEVINLNEESSIFPASRGGGVNNFSGTVNNNDKVLLSLYFSGGNVVMYAYDWNTGASAEETYTAFGENLFRGQVGLGGFTGLMTEWWHVNAYYGGETKVVYSNAALALSSGELSTLEYVGSNGTIVFERSQKVNFSSSTQLHYLTTNGSVVAASGYTFITGGTAHDVAVTNVAPSKTAVGRGLSENISVTVEDPGSYGETFNVTAYANNATKVVIIASQNITLTSGNSAIITFTWNTTGFAYGNYTISASVTLAPGETNNWTGPFSYGTVKVTIPGDANGDGKVDAQDFFILERAWSTSIGQPNYDPRADFNGDGKVDAQDFFMLEIHWDQSVAL